MAFYDPSKPRTPRITPPEPVEETGKVSTISATEALPVPTPSAPLSSDEPISENLTPADAANVPSPADNAEKPKKKAGRPAGSKSTPKTSIPTPKPDTRRNKQEDADFDKKIRTALYLQPKDHKRLKMLCVDIDMSMTEFGESACLAAMYSSYQCAAPDCNCEFVIRSSLSDATPSCPMCGGQKLSRPYLP